MMDKIISPYSWMIYPEHKKDNKKVMWFDTTLRDGEQVNGASLDPKDKVEIADYLVKLGVDAIEAGFAASSNGEMQAIKEISGRYCTKPAEYEYIDEKGDVVKAKKDVALFSLAMATEKNIDASYEAVRTARLPGIHTFIATADSHIRSKFTSIYKNFLQQTRSENEALRLSRDWVKNKAVAAVSYARKKFIQNNIRGLVEFSAEAATSSNLEFLTEVYSEAIRAGANICNVPDTEGTATNTDMIDVMTYLLKHVIGADKVVWSTHCHNDEGNAVSNSLTSINLGVSQIEGTVNGIGERAGNCDNLLVAYALFSHPSEHSDKRMQIDFRKSYPTSVKVQALTGYHLQRHYPIWGENAFTHASGIHADGNLKGDRVGERVYEINDPNFFGLGLNRLPLTRRSGKASLMNRLQLLGYDIPEHKSTNEQLIYSRFIDIAEKKRIVTDNELMDVMGYAPNLPYPIRLHSLDYHIKNNEHFATVVLEVDGQVHRQTAIGNGPVDAAFIATKKIIGNNVDVALYDSHSTGYGSSALSRTSIVLSYGKDKHLIRGEAYDTDIVRAAIGAFTDAIAEYKLRTR